MKVKDWLDILNQYDLEMEVYIDIRNILKRRLNITNTIVYTRQSETTNSKEVVLISIGKDDLLKEMPHPIEDEKLAKIKAKVLEKKNKAGL